MDSQESAEYYEININNKLDSSKLLFTIPVHEKQDIINNHIENILNFNPNSKIMIHVNKSFSNFNNLLTKYPNVYVNSKQFNYKFAKGLLWIHINNFLEAVRLNVDFQYYVIISSNELFIKNGLINYIEEYKNGLQAVEFSINNSWHNFHKGLEKEDLIIRLLKNIGLDSIYGGQTEGQFYEKYVFQKISDIYLEYFGTSELYHFETEEILPQTIFKSLHLEHSLPFTLQNYSNKIVFTENYIDKLANNSIIIEDNYLDNTLYSEHANKDCTSIYSIKRVDRNFNNIRNYLSRKGFVLNKEIFQLNTYYYSNNSSIILYDNNHIHFRNNKIINHKKDFHWFGYELNIGHFYLDFDIKFNNNIKYYENSGIKLHLPEIFIYSFFMKKLNINEWYHVSVPIHNTELQNIIFIFDDYLEDVDVEFKNIKFTEIRNNENNKENIVISLYNINNSITNDYSINYTNINNMIFDQLSKIYNIYTFITLNNNNNINQIVNLYKPYNIRFIDNNTNNDNDGDKHKILINSMFYENTKDIINFSNTHINIKFVIYFRLDSIFEKDISNFNFYINKFNFISYSIPYIEEEVSNSYEFLSMPYKYIDNFYNLLKNNRYHKNICHLIYSKLKNIIDINNFNFIYDENYSINTRNPLIKYLPNIENVLNNKGYLFNKNYINNIFYQNNYSKMLRNNKNEFYFYKNKTLVSESFMWIGLYLDNIEIDDYISNASFNASLNDVFNISINIDVVFDIKFIKKINSNNKLTYGLKIHEPVKYYNNWINDCKLDVYNNITLNIDITRKNQYIILNFDDYLDEIEFTIKNFKVLLNFIK